MSKRIGCALIISVLTVLVGSFSACSSDNPSVGGGSALEVKTFWLEPLNQNTIGVGQNFNVYAALKESTALEYPSYVDGAQVVWTSSNPSVAAINSSGLVAGLAEGTTVISASYQSYRDQIIVEVSGQFLSRSVFVLGQGMRTYSLYIPPFGSSAGPHPLLLSLHGGGGSAMIQASTSLLNKFAQSQKFYVAYVEGTGAIKTFNAGNCCGSAASNSVDDVLYARRAIEHIEAEFSVDTDKIFSTGFSNGGMMSHRLACDLADRISGIAAIGGASGQFDIDDNQYYACTPSRPIRVLQIHATNDRNYPIEGGYGDGFSNTPFYSVESTIETWRLRNNLTSQTSVENISSTTQCRHYRTVSNGALPSAPVSLCIVNPTDVYDPINEIVFGGGHSWPGGARSPAPNSDVPPQDFNANSYLWGFLNNN